MSDFANRVSRMGALAEPTRLALYRFVVAQGQPVSRDQAAAGVGLPHHTAKFHLDRLVEEGLLDVEFRRLTGRSGPGAGRPSKLYRRTGEELSVSLPDRRYDLAGDVLADAAERHLSTGEPLTAAIQGAAKDAGTRIVDAADKPDGRMSELRRVATVLAEHGYEPKVEQTQLDQTELVLTNCPFDSLAHRHRTLVCGLNLALVGAVTERLGCSEVAAELDPAPPHCCVRVRRT